VSLAGYLIVARFLKDFQNETRSAFVAAACRFGFEQSPSTWPHLYEQIHSAIVNSSSRLKRQAATTDRLSREKLNTSDPIDTREEIRDYQVYEAKNDVHCAEPQDKSISNDRPFKPNWNPRRGGTAMLAFQWIAIFSSDRFYPSGRLGVSRYTTAIYQSSRDRKCGLYCLKPQSPALREGAGCRILPGAGVDLL
jgi:hypothetical protein